VYSYNEKKSKKKEERRKEEEKKGLENQKKIDERHEMK